MDRRKMAVAHWVLLVACLGMLALRSSQVVRASENLDLSFVSRDAFAAVVLHPKAILRAPEVEMLPVEVLVAACVENLGFDPSEIDEAVGILGMGGLATGTPGMGAVLHFGKPYDQAAVSGKLQAFGNTREATHAGKAYQESQTPGGFGFYLANERTLVIGTNLQLKNMLAADKVESRLVKLLKRLDTNQPATAVLDVATLRPLVQLAMGNLPPVPPEFQEFLQLPNLLEWVQLSIALEGGLNVHVTLAGKDGAGAEKLKELAQKAKELARQMIAAQIPPAPAGAASPTDKAMSDYLRRVTNKLLDAIEIKVDAERVEVALLKGNGTATVGVMVALLLPATQAAREAARRANSINNLRQIGIALQVYHDAKKQFPAPAIRDKDGKPLLSWRVAILPYLEENNLYQQFHLDEPWDSEHNRTLIAKMPSVYANPNVPLADKTVYLGAAGPGMYFGERDGRTIRDITDGTSNTISVLEADLERAVEWTKPEDLAIDPAQPLAGLGKLRPGGCNALFVDGSVHFLANEIDPKLLHSLLTIAGGEPVQIPQ